MSRHRRIFAMVAAGLMLLAVAVAPAAAAKPGTETFSFSESGQTAHAGHFDCVENSDGTVTCSGEDIFAFAGKRHPRGEGATRSTEVCYSTFADTFTPGTEGGSFTHEFGCVQGASVVSGDDLSSATISPTTVTLEGESCTYTGDPETEPVCTPTAPRQVVVEGTLTGSGPVVRESFRSFHDDGHCVHRDSSSGYSREATFQGTVNGEPFAADHAFLREGKFSFSQTCSIEE